VVFRQEVGRLFFYPFWGPRWLCRLEEKDPRDVLQPCDQDLLAQKGPLAPAYDLDKRRKWEYQSVEAPQRRMQ